MTPKERELPLACALWIRADTRAPDLEQAESKVARLHREIEAEAKANSPEIPDSSDGPGDCPNCGHAKDPTWTFCPHCGEALPGALKSSLVPGTFRYAAGKPGSLPHGMFVETEGKLADTQQNPDPYAEQARVLFDNVRGWERDGAIAEVAAALRETAQQTARECAERLVSWLRINMRYRAMDFSQLAQESNYQTERYYRNTSASCVLDNTANEFEMWTRNMPVDYGPSTEPKLYDEKRAELRKANGLEPEAERKNNHGRHLR